MPNLDLEVRDKFTGEIATGTPLADADRIGRAIAFAATESMRRLAAYGPQAILEHCVARFRERFDELALALCMEAGKPIRDSRGEVTRLIDTFKVAAEESVRMTGEVMPLDISARAPGTRVCGNASRSARVRATGRHLHPRSLQGAHGMG